MKKVNTTLFFLFYSCFLLSQDYTDYYTLCNDADKEIYLKNYSKALAKLKLAFNSVEYIHTQNYEKASRCAVKINDFKQGYFYAKKAIINGNPIPFWQWKAYKKFRESPQFDFLKDSIPIFKEQHQNSINLDYKEMIDSLHFVDQRIIRKRISLKGDYQINTAELPDDLYSLDTLILKSLIDLIGQYGFPSEENIGLEGYKKAWVLIHHNFRLERNEQYHPLLKKALFGGELLPEDFELTYEQYHQFVKGNTFFSTVDKNLTKENLNRLNKNRKEYCLKDLSAFKIKKRGLVMKQLW